MRSIEIEQILELLVESDAQDEGQLRRRVEQARLDGRYGLPRHAHEAREFKLRQPRLRAGGLKAVLQLELAVVAVDIVDPKEGSFITADLTSFLRGT